VHSLCSFHQLSSADHFLKFKAWETDFPATEYMKKAGLFLLLTLLSGNLFAQQDVEMADTMRSNGKIYVVVAVIAVVLIGLIIYLLNLDRKLTRLEKEIKK